MRSLLLAVVVVLLGCGNGGAPSGDDLPGDDSGEPPGGISWRTPHVLFKAQRFSIDAGGETFFARVHTPRVHSDFLASYYTTLEVTWLELGVEMRLYIYFSSDGTETWSNELRTYDGNTQGDWITYTGDFFRAPLGQPFTEDLDLSSGSDGLHVAGLHLQAFLPAVCDGSPYFLEPYDPVVWLEPDSGPSYSFHQALYIRDATCAHVEPPSGGMLVWSTDDPTIATIEPATEIAYSAELHPVSLGETTAHAELRGPDGTPLASTQFTVRVHPYP